MERRSFLLALLALSTGSAAAAIAGTAEAAAATPVAPPRRAGSDALTLPDGQPIEYAQYRRRRRRTVCSWRRDRWGRRVRVCRSVWF